MNITLTDENFEKEMQNIDKPVVVDFFATWCEPCSVLGPILEKVIEELKDRVVLLKADVNTIPATAQKFNVDRIPMVVLFNKGKAVSGFIGLRSEDFIKDWLEKATRGANDELVAWSDNYAKDLGFKLNPDKKVVDNIVKGLLKNQEKYGQKYCPCRRISGDKEADKKNVCPCYYHREELEKDGKCFCGLFVK